MLFLTFSPTFVILTISYEGLFYFIFCMTLVTWVRLEYAVYMRSKTALALLQLQVSGSPNHSNSDAPTQTTVDGQTYTYRPITVSDARIALFFFFLLQSAFFSTGNIASVSSFSLESVARLIPVFNPFAQGALLILKLMIPFAIISANLGILNRRLEVAPSALFMIVMTISDVMTLNFFYMVRDEGSWLDIGTTISHFVIASLLCVFVAGLEFVSEAFISGIDIKAPSIRGVTELVNGRESKANGPVSHQMETPLDSKKNSKISPNGIRKGSAVDVVHSNGGAT
jgi:GPI ethanolamine phosphate transferase 1